MKAATKVKGSLLVIGDVLMQAVDEITHSHFTSLIKYVATDITASWGPALQQLIRGAPIEFKVRLV